MHTPGPTPLSAHWVSLVQIGVVPLQLLVTPPSVVIVSQPTHWPAIVPALAQTGVAPVQGPVAAPASRASLLAPPSEEPLLTGPLAVAPGALQPWHWFCTQKALPAVGQSLLLTHSTQPPDAAQTGVAAGQALPPSAPPTAAHDTQVFWAEQNGTPAALLHWLLALQATHLVFTQ